MFSKFFKKKLNSSDMNGADYLKIAVAITDKFNSSEKSTYKTKIKGTVEECELNYYLIPYAFDLENQLKPNGIHSFEELYHIITPKINFSEVPKGYFNDSTIDFLHLSFRTKESNNRWKDTTHDFLIFIGMNNSDEANIYEVLYSDKFDADFIDFWRKSEWCSLHLPLNGTHASALEVMDDVLLGFCKIMEIDGLEMLFPAPDKKVVYEADVQLYADLLKLINPDLEKTKINKRAKKLYEKLIVKGKPDEGDNADLVVEDSWHSDWKFDIEEMEDFLTSCLGETVTIDVPEETYSADLFPYIQNYLAQKGKVLMHYNSWADSYFFFVLDLKDLDEVETKAYFAHLHIEAVHENS